jgi:hypothetical protein
MAGEKSDGTAVKVAVITGLTGLLAAGIGVVPMLLDDDAGPAPPPTTREVDPPVTTEDSTTTDNSTTTEAPPATTIAPPPPTTVAPASTTTLVPVPALTSEQLAAALVTTADLPPGFQEVPFFVSGATSSDVGCASAQQVLEEIENAVPDESTADRELYRLQDSWDVKQSILVPDDPARWLDAVEAVYVACSGAPWTEPTGISGFNEFVPLDYVPPGSDASVAATITVYPDDGSAQQVAYVYNVAVGQVVSTILLSTYAGNNVPLLADVDGFLADLIARLPR